MIKLKKQAVVSKILVTMRKPQVGDAVVGVLRVRDHGEKAGLIQYGIVFQLKEEAL
jgi:hypothetical protein